MIELHHRSYLELYGSMLDFTYCEFSEFLFTTQPLNTFSSVAFPFVAYFIYRMVPPSHPRWALIWPTVPLCILIGIGSTLWHTYQQRWALALDVLPIFTFLFVFQCIFLKKFTSWSRRRIAYDIVGLMVAMGLASRVGNEVFLQKSNAFVPVALWLIYAGVMVGQRYPRQARLCFFAALVFALAILFRIVDMPLCDRWLEGTHFLWHSFSALTLYIVMRCFRPVRRGNG